MDPVRNSGRDEPGNTIRTDNCRFFLAALALSGPGGWCSVGTARTPPALNVTSPRWSLYTSLTVRFWSRVMRMLSIASRGLEFSGSSIWVCGKSILASHSWWLEIPVNAVRVSLAWPNSATCPEIIIICPRLAAWERTGSSTKIALEVVGDASEPGSST